jgi:hypothetical protein
MHGFSNVDWVGDKNTHRSISRYCFSLAGGVVTWANKKQTYVALSNTKSEYMTLSKPIAKVI